MSTHACNGKEGSRHMSVTVLGLDLLCLLLCVYMHSCALWSAVLDETGCRWGDPIGSAQSAPVTILGHLGCTVQCCWLVHICTYDAVWYLPVSEPGVPYATGAGGGSL